MNGLLHVVAWTAVLKTSPHTLLLYHLKCAEKSPSTGSTAFWRLFFSLSKQHKNACLLTNEAKRIVGVVYSNKIFRALPHLLVFPCYSVATIKNITSGSLNQQFNDWYSSKRFRQNCFRRTLAFIILFTILTSLTFVVRHINCKRKRHVWQGLYTKQGYLSFRLVER